MIITNKQNLDTLIVKSVSSDYQYTDKKYSVTSILTDKKEIVLKRRHNNEIIRDVNNMTWLMFGTAFHEFMEKQEDDFVKVSKDIFDDVKDLAIDFKIEASTTETNNDSETIETNMEYYVKPKLKEKHLVYKCKTSDYVLTGYSDLYNVLTQTVTDYKTASVNKVIFGDWEDYIKQLKLYCVQLRSMGFPCNKGKIVAFLKDWSMSSAERVSDYPKSAVYSFEIEFNDDELTEEINWVERYFRGIETIEKQSDDDIEICNEKMRCFGKKPLYALMKNNNKTATKLFDNESEAFEYLRYNRLDTSKDKYRVEYRPAEEMRCKKYCDSCHWCNHYRDNYATHILEVKGKCVYSCDNLLDAKTAQDLVYKNSTIKEIIR